MTSNNQHKLSTAASKANSKFEPSTFGGTEAMEVNIAGTTPAPPPQDHNDPLHDKEHGTAQHKPKEGLLGKIKSHMPGHSKEKEATADGKRESISDSGPYIFAFDPKQGKEVLQKNPHWPNEDSWKKEGESEGQWAFGSMMGQQNKDFGGTVG